MFASQFCTQNFEPNLREEIQKKTSPCHLFAIAISNSKEVLYAMQRVKISIFIFIVQSSNVSRMFPLPRYYICYYIYYYIHVTIYTVQMHYTTTYQAPPLLVRTQFSKSI